MIHATVGIALCVVLFLVFGLFALADGRGGCGGDCGNCSGGACELESDLNGSVP